MVHITSPIRRLSQEKDNGLLLALEYPSAFMALPLGGTSSHLSGHSGDGLGKSGALPSVCQWLAGTAGLGYRLWGWWGASCGAVQCLARARPYLPLSPTHMHAKMSWDINPSSLWQWDIMRVLYTHGYKKTVSVVKIIRDEMEYFVWSETK